MGAFALGRVKHAAPSCSPLSPVDRWERQGALHRLVTPGGTVTARRVVFATNGWTPDGLHKSIDARVWPALSNILVTRPLKGLIAELVCRALRQRQYAGVKHT